MAATASTKKLRLTPPTGRSADERVGRAVANVTVGDADALECGVCFHALRPPIFQCEVGLVVCSACRDKLAGHRNGKCHVCGAATSGYRRCYAMERVVDCLHIPCPYAAHGCHATPPYHGLESHRQVCPHGPRPCPGESCGFFGSTAALLHHFRSAHKWPYRFHVLAGEVNDISVYVGFNFIVLTDPERDDGKQAATTGSAPCRLFLLNVTQERHGRAISVLCIHRHADAAATVPASGVDRPVSMSTRCQLAFTRDDESFSSEFRVVCTDLSSGLPNPDGCFQFVVPNAFLGGHNKFYFKVKVRIVIS